MLSWDEIRAMSDMFEIACHTVNHPRLSRLSSGEARREIGDAKLRIEQETGGTCRGLAYPSGDFSDDVVSVARSLGFDYAVTTRFGNNKRDADRMRLARRDAGYLYAGDRFSPAYFHAVLSGATDWLRGGDSVRKAGSNSDQREMQPAGVNYSKDGTNDPGARPLVVHVVHHLTVGGLENGLVNLVNRLPQSAYRHAIICLTDYSDFRERITTPNVDVHALHKRPGKDPKIYLDLWRLFRRLKPDVVHTRNIATLEAQLPALIAGVPHRLHGEHGRDTRDIDGGNRKYRILRKVFRPVVSRYIALSHDLQCYLETQIGIAGNKISHICNGVDTERFLPHRNSADIILPDAFHGNETVIIGTVGRMEPEKDPVTLAEAFIRLVKEYPAGRQRLRLVMIGDGILLEQVRSILDNAGVGELVWLPGERDDVPRLLGSLDMFVLTSLVEGISNTILEAMSSGLPVVATRVGGNSEIVEDGVTGLLVPRSDPEALADAIRRYIDDPELRLSHGASARIRCEERYSIDGMVQSYHELYSRLLCPDRKTTLMSQSS
jgi:sugar transferase (PEP-CTERM/EpsH1 system associated)